MARLGDHFPAEQQQEHITRHLTPGRVLYLFCDFTNPPKEKYLALVCPGPVPLFFVVNSGISTYIQSRPERRTCQVSLPASDHDFLAHDSFLDCSEVVPDLREAEVRRQLVGDIGRIKGELSEAAKAQVISVVQTAHTISAAHKRAIEQALHETQRDF